MSDEATIRRGARNARYTTVPNDVFEDVRLSMEARWLVGYLLSKPDNWVVRMADIARKGGCGRDKVRKMVNELVELGYAEKDQPREDGRFGKLSLVVYDEPRQTAPSNAAVEPTGVASLPQPEKPSTVNPSTAKPSLVKTEDLAIPDSSFEREGARAAGEEKPPYLPEGLSKRAEALFYKSFKVWHRFDVSPKPPMLAAWAKLSWDDMQASADAVPRYLAAVKDAGMSHAPAISTFLDLEGRLWEGFPPEPAPVAPTTVEAKPFGPLWNAINLRDIRLTPPQAAPPPTSAYMRDLVAEDSERGRRERLRRQAEHGWPMVNLRYRQALSRKGFVARAEDAWLASLMEAVPVDGATMSAWREFYEAEGMPWVPDWGEMRVVFFPAGGPAALGAFEQALRGARDDAGRSQAAE